MDRSGRDEGSQDADGRESRGRRVVAGIRALRELLPGDSSLGDRLTSSGGAQLLDRVSQATAERPGILREAGLTALQVWQALTDDGSGRGERELAIAFTDLVGFSTWALSAGDEAAVRLLREVGDALEPPVGERGGEVVKWLGDGMMAAFYEPQDAVEAVLDGGERLAGVGAPGYRARIRAGVHLGLPRRVGGDYLGIDVNVAARVADAATGGQLLVSDRALERLDTAGLRVRRKLLFRAKGVPRGVAVYSVSRR